MSRKIITVFGATGQQGGSVAKIFLEDAALKAEWAVRAVTRDTSKDSSKKLASQGAEVVSADVNDKATLVEAMKGAAAVFAVTNYWEKADAELEVRQGKNLVDAAKEAGVGQFIWSSLVNVTKVSNGELKHVYHFDSKAAVEEYARSAGIPATFFMPGLYMSGLPGGMLAKRPPHDNWVLGLPVSESTPIPLFDPPSDTGKFIKAAVLHKDKLLGKQLRGTVGYVTVRQILDDFKKTFPEAGKDATFYQLKPEEFKGALLGKDMPDFVAQELLENMLLLEKYGYYGGADVEEGIELVEEPLTSWTDFVKRAPAFKDLK